VLDPDYDGTTVRAYSVAAWGSLGGSTDLFPLAFCWDQFNQKTNNATTFGPPQYHIFHKTSPPTVELDCPTSEETYPGGFGWLNITHPDFAARFDATTCTATASFNEWERGRTGVGLPNTTAWNTCVAKLKAKVNEVAANPNAEPLLVPIFDNWRNPGANGEFRLAGFGAFMPTGYHLGGSQFHPSNNVCLVVQNRCLRGYFVEWVVTNGVIGAGDYYGVQTPLTQLANVATTDVRLLTVTPYDKSAIGAIEKAILESDLGLTPNNDGQVVRLQIPELTEERRRELVRVIHAVAEEGRVAVRNIRRDVMNDLRDLKKEGEVGEDSERRAEEQLQRITDDAVSKIDALIKAKEDELMEV
jgi:ribosome recycling factor